MSRKKVKPTKMTFDQNEGVETDADVEAPIEQTIATPIQDGLVMDSGVNPLNTLSFDVNTLIPHSEFNWDCVDGMDSIHDSIMKSYQFLMLKLTDLITKIEDRIEIIDRNLIGVLDRCVCKVSDTVATIDSVIANQMQSRLDNLQGNYGNGSSPCCWWIVYRQGQDKKWYPFVENSPAAPIGQESYGPFQDYNLLLQNSAQLQQLFQPHNVQNNAGDTIINNAALSIINNAAIANQAQLGVSNDARIGNVADANISDTPSVVIPLANLSAPIAISGSDSSSQITIDSQQSQEPLIPYPQDQASQSPISQDVIITSNQTQILEGPITNVTQTQIDQRQANESSPIQINQESGSIGFIDNEAIQQRTTDMPISRAEIDPMERTLDTRVSQPIQIDDGSISQSAFAGCCSSIAQSLSILAQVAEGKNEDAKATATSKAEELIDIYEIDYLFTSEGQEELDEYFNRTGKSVPQELRPERLSDASVIMHNLLNSTEE